MTDKKQETSEKPEKPEKPGLLSRSPFYDIKQLVSIGMTIACMVLAILAFIDLNNYTSDVEDILENWKTLPIMDVHIANFTDGCPSDYGTVSVSNTDFPGLSKGHCGCTASTLYASSYPNCSSTDEASIECMSANSQNDVSATSWRREKICFKRGGLASVNFKDGYFRRPYPDSDGNCPSDYKKCGTGSYDDNRAICFPNTEKCPITGILISKTVPTGGSWIQADGVFSYDNAHLYYRTEYPDELPLVDLKSALTKYRDGYETDDYNGKNNQRGPCYIGVGQRYSKSIQVSDTELVSYSIKPPKSCNKPDPRFILYDRIGIDDHFLGILERSNKCSGFTLYKRDDPRYTTSGDPDYFYSRIACGTSPYICDRDADMGTNCAVNDQICDLVVNQNVCGQYVQAARGVGGESETFGLYRRSEIIWSTECEVDREKIYTNRDPLRAALYSQLAVVIVGCLFGTLAGIIWPVALLTCLRKKYCNVVNYDITIMDRVDPFIHIFKAVPLVPSIYYVGKIYRLFATAGKDECSDPTSNETFDFLATTLPSIYNKSISNAAIEALMLLMGLYFYRQKVVKNRKIAANKVAPVDSDDKVGGNSNDNNINKGNLNNQSPPMQPQPIYQQVPQPYAMAPMQQAYPMQQPYPMQQGYPMQQPYQMMPQYPQQQQY